MASKKILSMIEEAREKSLPAIKKKFRQITKSYGMTYAFDDDCKNIVCYCYNCGSIEKISASGHTGAITCPKCGTRNAERSSYVYVVRKQQMQAKYLFKFNDNVLAFATYHSDIGIENDEFVISPPELYHVFFYDLESNVLDSYKRTDSNWSSSKTCDFSDYYYGQRSETFAESEEVEKKWLGLDFIKNYRVQINSRIGAINNAYRDYIEINGISRKKAKKDENITYPNLPEITDEMIVAAIPKMMAYKSEKNGLVQTVTCLHCGAKKLMPSDRTYVNTHDVCECAVLGYHRSYVHMVDTILFEDKNIAIRYSTFSVQNNPRNNNASQFIDSYEPCVVSRNTELVVYATAEKIYFFDSDEQCNLSDANTNVAGMSSRYNYNSTLVAYQSEEKILSDIKGSVIANIGLLELIEGNMEYNVLNALCHYVNYFELYNKSKCIEQISKLKMQSLMRDITQKLSLPRFINKKETSAAKMLGVTNFQLKQLREVDANIDTISRYKTILANDQNVAFEDCRLFIDDNEMYDMYKQSLNLGVPNLNSNPKKLANYLQSLDDYQCMDIKEGFRIWIDYMRMCTELQSDLTDKSVVFTNSLKLAHDRAVRKYNNLKNQKMIENFNNAVVAYSYLAYENDDFLVKPPSSQEELYEEGRKLNHCVGTYAKSVAEGTSIIMFVRSKRAPESPLVTVEIRNKKIWQARGKFNIQANKVPGVKDFLSEWCKERDLSFSYY